MPHPRRPRRVPPGRRPDALACLEADHRWIVGLFRRLAREHVTADERARLVREACDALDAHAQLEREVFYPAVRHAVDCRAALAEGEVEHRTLDALIDSLRSGASGAPDGAATARVLVELLRRHIAKEERRIFTPVRGTSLDLVGLGELLRDRRADILRQRAPDGRGRAARTDGYSGFAPF